MASITVLFALVLGFLATAKADGDGVVIYHKAECASDACEQVLTKMVLYFPDDDPIGYCNKDLQQALGSMAYCLKSLPSEVGIPYFLESCKEYNLTMEEFEAAYDNATEYLVKNVTAYPGFSKDEYFYLPIKVPHKKLDGAYASYIGRYYNYNRANYYGWALMLYWVVLVLFSGLINLIRAVAPKFVNSFNGKISNTFRKYVTLPALFNKKRVSHGRIFRFFEFVIPSRVETIYIFVWFILALAFNVANYRHDSPNIIWPIKWEEMGRKVGDRTGVMVLYLIPQLVLFAGRNNFMLWISGWSYARFNVIHHWMARVSFALMFAHAIGMTLNGIGLGKYETRNAKPYVRWGYVAIICAGIMCFHSMAFLRKHNYEMFVLSHNILSVFFVAGTWIHTADAKFQQMMYATAAAWCFDKAMRLVRMAWFGVRTAQVQLIAEETLRVTVPRPSSWKSYPLSHAYIYFFRPSCFWQSHPFTIVDSALKENEISFYIKVKGGMTNSLYQYLSNQPDQKAQIKCSVEGPYGAIPSLQHYETVAYLSGGNGIPGLYDSAMYLSRKHTKQKLRLYWIIRHWKSIEWFYEELKALEKTNVQPVIYVTQFNTPLDQSFIEKFDNSSVDEKVSQPNSDKADSETVNNDHAQKLMATLPFIEFREGRPDLEAIVRQEITESAGAVAIVACGHDTFVDQSRKTTLSNLENGKRVDFYDTMAVW